MIILLVILAIIAIAGFAITTALRKGLDPKDEYDKDRLKILGIIRGAVIGGCVVIFAIAMLIGSVKLRIGFGPFSRPNLLLLLVVPGYISWPLLCFESGQRAKKAGIWPLLHRILRTRERVKTGIWPLFPAIWPLLKPQSGQQKPSICKGLRALCPLCPLFSLN